MDLFDNKIRSIPHNQNTVDALEAFYDAARAFERKCGERDEEYRQLFRNLTNTQKHLIENLVLSREQCFK